MDRLIGIFCLLGTCMATFASFAKDLCATGLLQAIETEDAVAFRFSDVPEVLMKNEDGCDFADECSYAISAMDLETTRLIAEDVRIANICSAFRRKERDFDNPYYESSNSTVSFYEKSNEVTYSLPDSGMRLSIELVRYHNGTAETRWGFWESAKDSGGILPIGVRVVEVQISEQRN
jgi:hypothetical protein